jgi:glycosyltransferase involved in cell wall biosynthesis
MKVLHITNAYPTPSYGAYGVFIKEQIDSLERRGIDNDVVFINAREKGNLQYLLAGPRIRTLVKKCDIVHCHHAYSGMAYLLASFCEKPLVFSNLGDIQQQKKKLDKFLFAVVSRKARAVIYKNVMQIDDSEKKFHHLPNGVNTELFRPIDKQAAKQKIGLSVDDKFILFVSAAGTGNSNKRHDKFSEVLRILNNEGMSLKPLIMAGVERNITPFYFNACEALLLTSDHEGSPNAVKEAMACDVRVVSTNVGNVKKMIEGCRTSFVSEEGSPDDLARLLTKSLSLTEHNERTQIFKKQLDMNTVANKLIRIYESTLK